MPPRGSNECTQAPAPTLFVTTRWSIVLSAKEKGSPDSASALETLCRTYWYPLYAFVRSSGYSPHDAQDLTQEFFARLLAKDYLRVVDPEKGRFRTFLKMAVKRFLTNEWERVRACKRGGGQAHLVLDTTLMEARFQEQSVNSLTPDSLYDRQWALALLGEAMGRLEQEYRIWGKTLELETLKLHLMSERGTIPYGELALAMRATEGAARVAVHRLRKRFRDLFREVIGETIAAAADLDEEVRYVLAVLGRG